MDALVGATMAIVGVSITTMLNMIVIWWLDRFEKEPVWLLLLVFIWGALPSIAIALIFSAILDIPVGLAASGSEYVHNLLGAVIIAPLVEESAKAIALLIVFLVLRNEFDDILDGIIYGAIVGLGFAFTEDLFYLFGSLGTGGVGEMTIVFFLRIFIFGLNHAFFTSLTGIGLGLAKLTRWYIGIPLAIMGLVASMVLHGTHNLLVSLPGEMIFSGIALAWIVHILAALGLFVLVIIVWFIEMAWIRNELKSEMEAGYVTEFEYNNVVKFFGRFKLETKFLFYMDIAGYFRIKKMFNKLVKLAFRKRAYKRKGRKSILQQVVNLRQEVADLRQKFAK